MQRVIDVLEAERDELRSGFVWLEEQIAEFGGRHNGATAITPAPRCHGPATAQRATVAVLPGVLLRAGSKLKIVVRVSQQPGSSAGDVAKALDFERP